MDIQNAPRRDVTIQGVILSVAAPYAEGHPLSQIEASVLNQTFAENIRNNYASAVKEALEKAKAAGTEANLAELQSALDEYMAEYEFGVRGTRTARVSADPVEREAIKLARERVKQALAKAGFKVARGDEEPGGNVLSKDKLEELVEAALEKYPDIREAARAIVAAKANAGQSILEGMQL